MMMNSLYHFIFMLTSVEVNCCKIANEWIVTTALHKHCNLNAFTTLICSVIGLGLV